MKHFPEHLQALTATSSSTRLRGWRCRRRTGRARPAPRRAPALAAAPADAGDALAPGRLEARLAGRPAVARPGRHARRCDQRDPLGLPGGRRGHRLEPPGASRDNRGQGPVLLPLHRPRRALFPHPRRPGGRVSREQPTQVGRALAQLGIEHIAPQARPLGAALPDRLPAVAAEAPGTAFVPVARYSAGTRPAKSATTNTVRWKGRSLQIPGARSSRPSRVRACSYTNSPTARPRSSGARTASPTSRRPRRHPTTWRRVPFDADRGVDNAAALPTPATTTEADNLCATYIGQLDASATAPGVPAAGPTCAWQKNAALRHI
jgi:hypothetical protein